MSKFIEVHEEIYIVSQNNKEKKGFEPRLINIDHIVDVECQEGTAFITFNAEVGGEVIRCRESYEEVKRMVLNE